jgi:hypothetical protein
MVSMLVFTVLFVSLASTALTTRLPFNPREYPKNVVSCPAVNRAENTKVDIELRTSAFLFFAFAAATLIRNTRRLR